MRNHRACKNSDPQKGGDFENMGAKKDNVPITGLLPTSIHSPDEGLVSSCDLSPYMQFAAMQIIGKPHQAAPEVDPGCKWDLGL